MVKFNPGRSVSAICHGVAYRGVPMSDGPYKRVLASSITSLLKAKAVFKSKRIHLIFVVVKIGFIWGGGEGGIVIDLLCSENIMHPIPKLWFWDCSPEGMWVCFFFSLSAKNDKWPQMGPEMALSFALSESILSGWKKCPMKSIGLNSFEANSWNWERDDEQDTDVINAAPSQYDLRRKEIQLFL